MKSVRKPSPQTVAVLSALGENATGWSHGYELCRALEIKAGTVYPILIRLAERDLVETSWEQDAPAGRPPRHLYRLSPAGTEFLSQLHAARARRVGQATKSVAAARPVTGTA